MSNQTTLKSLEKKMMIAKIVESGFQDVNSRLGKVESRLDVVEDKIDPMIQTRLWKEK